MQCMSTFSRPKKRDSLQTLITITHWFSLLVCAVCVLMKRDGNGWFHLYRSYNTLSYIAHELAIFFYFRILNDQTNMQQHTAHSWTQYNIAHSPISTIRKRMNRNVQAKQCDLSWKIKAKQINLQNRLPFQPINTLILNSRGKVSCYIFM